MTHFVLDASVAMRWHLETDKAVDQRYAEAVLMSLREADALVPHLWHIESTSVLLAAERTKQTNAGNSGVYICNYPIPEFILFRTTEEREARRQEFARLIVAVES